MEYVENVITLLPPFSHFYKILFLKTDIRILYTFNELARLVMGTIFLVSMNISQELTVFHGRQKLTSAKN